MKKLLIVCLSLVLLISPVYASAAEKTTPMTKGYKGDVNVDGEIDAKDALFALRISVIKQEFPLNEQDAADVDNNTLVNAKDALEILKYTVGKDSAINKNKVVTTVKEPKNYFYWDVLQDNICTTEQAWLCETYEDYQAFLSFGYVGEADQLHKEFFETRGVVLWYRCSGLSTGSLHYSGAFVQGDRVYLDIVPYGTDALDERNALDTVYGFDYVKGDFPVSTVIIRKKHVAQISRSYALAQFEF